MLASGAERGTHSQLAAPAHCARSGDSRDSAHTISSTQIAAPPSARMSERGCDEMSSRIHVTMAPVRSFSRGNCCSSTAATRAKSACACSSATPGRRRATPIRKLSVRSRYASSGKRCGTHRSMELSGNRKSGGITPRTVYGASLSVSA
jgi:hypothetical protein